MKKFIKKNKGAILLYLIIIFFGILLIQTNKLAEETHEEKSILEVFKK